MAIAQESKAPKKTTATARSSAPKVNREAMIAEAAYYIAEKRGFASGDHVRDWLDAEAEIDQKSMTRARKSPAKK